MKDEEEEFDWSAYADEAYWEWRESESEGTETPS